MRARNGQAMNEQGQKTENATDKPKPKSVVGVVVHSFFIIPFMIAVFSLIVFVMIQLMVREDHTVYDYLNDIKVGGSTKRWQAAFELAKILGHPEHVPEEPRFTREMIALFDHAQHDDVRVRQYLARAMGRTENPAFVEPLLEALDREREAELPEIILALGMLQDAAALPALHGYLEHPNPLVRNRAAMALGFIGDRASVPPLRAALHDTEPNVGWNAAIALAKLGDTSGRERLLQLLDREHMKRYPEIDRREQDQAMLIAIEAAALLDDPELNAAMRKLAEEDPNMKVREAAFRALR